MAGHLEFGYDADTASAGVGDEVFRHPPAYRRGRRSRAGELRIELALDAEALVFGEVPVEDVELNGGHAVEVAFEHVHRLEVPAAVDHQAAPCEPRRIVNRDRREHVVAARRLHELNQRREASHRTDHGRGFDCARRSDGERIRLVLIDGLNRLSRSLDYDRQRAARFCGRLFEREGKIGLLLKLLHGSQNGSIEPRIIEARDGSMKLRRKYKAAGRVGQVCRLRHQCIHEGITG